jgi:hypothetical protein
VGSPSKGLNFCRPEVPRIDPHDDVTHGEGGGEITLNGGYRANFLNAFTAELNGKA